MLRTIIHDEIAKIVPPDTVFSVVPSEQQEHGDYASNVALVLAKKEGKNPMEVAEDMALQLQRGRLSQHVEKVEVARPGFLNFFIAPQALEQKLKEIIDSPNAWGSSNTGEGKTVLVEYFQLNIAKRPHVGHLRSAVIGDALKRIFLAAGYHAVSDTHVGDWGTQFGILLLECKTQDLSLGYFHNMPDPFLELERLYIAGNERIEKDPDLRNQAKEEFAKLERGDKENRALWELMVDVSMQKLKESAERLGLLPFDEHQGESAYESAMPEIAKEAITKGIAKKMEDGAVIVDLQSEGLDEAVLIKSDGASTYLLRDLAAIKHRKEKYNFWKNLYLVDVRQSHHFRQVFRVAELLGFEGANESEHVSYGFMRLPEGMLSTRTANIISLDAVLDEAERRARAIIQEKNPDLQNADVVARQVALSALKYFDLSHHRTSDIVFDWDKALSFEGNTGPYIQYTHARLKSILRKTTWESDSQVTNKNKFSEKLSTLEHRIAVSVARFPEVIEDTIKELTPNTLALYCFELAQLANEFYHSHPVAQESDEQKKQTRIMLIESVALTLKRGLYILGIDAPEEM